MGLTGYLRWSNPPSGGPEQIIDALAKSYSGYQNGRVSTQVTSYRSNFSVPDHKLPPPPPIPSSTPPPTYDRHLYTSQTTGSPYLVSLLEDRHPAEGKEPQLCFSVSPPSSLGSILVATKSGFVLPPRAVAGASSVQVMDMGTNSAKAVRAQINTIKLEAVVYEIPLVRLGLGGVSGLSTGGSKPDLEFVVKVGSLAGKGLVIEAEYIPTTPPSPGSTPLAHLEAFLHSLLPPSSSVPTQTLTTITTPRPNPQSWRSIGVPEEEHDAGGAGTGWEDPVEKGRRSAFMLIELMREEGLV